MCDNQTIHNFYEFLGKSCPCGGKHIHKNVSGFQNPEAGGQTYMDAYRQEIESPEIGGATDMFPARGLGSTSTGTGQGLQEGGGPTNPSFPFLSEEERRRVEIGRLKEERGRLKEEFRYRQKQDRLLSKIEELQEEIASTPFRKPSGLREDSASEIDALQPPPQTPAGQSALAQREAMKLGDEEAKKALTYLVGLTAGRNLSYGDYANFMKSFEDTVGKIFTDLGRTNPPSKVPAFPGRSGSSGVYRKSAPFGDKPDKTSSWLVTKHAHEHSPETVSCECGYPQNKSYDLKK